MAGVRTRRVESVLCAAGKERSVVNCRACCVAVASVSRHCWGGDGDARGEGHTHMRLHRLLVARRSCHVCTAP
eukprot:2900197-Amphidinium_carterae.1